MLRGGRRLGAGGWSGRHCAEFPPGFWRQLLVFLPFLDDVLPLLRGKLLQRLELLARYLSLRGGELGPGAHLLLHALLLGRPKVGVAFGDAQPFLPALGVKLIPVRGEWRQGTLIGCREFRPRRRPWREWAGNRGRADARRRKDGQADQGSKLLSQFWNPRSR